NAFLGPLAAGVPRALVEVDHGCGWESLDVIHGEDRGPIDHAMDHQAMFGRIDVGDTCMVTLEEEAVRGHRSVQVRQRGAARGIGGQSQHMSLERRAGPVLRGVWSPFCHPGRNVRWDRGARLGLLSPWRHPDLCRLRHVLGSRGSLERVLGSGWASPCQTYYARTTRSSGH